MDGADFEAIRENVRGAQEQARAEAAEPIGPLPLLDLGAWEGVHPPVREWAWHELAPHRQATYLTGAGSAGKSLLGQQLCSCTALGHPCLGIATRRAVALYVTCEDDAAELHRRQDAICEALDCTMGDLAGRLHLCSLAGAVGNELATWDPQNRMTTTPAWDRLRATVDQVRPGLIVLDNVAHLFAGNENIRVQVASFCSLLNGLAADFDCAVIFVGHPNKAGADFSGSTAWENQVRARLFLDRAKPATEGDHVDPDARTLTRGKANYAQLGGAIRFRWYRGAFARDEDLATTQLDVIKQEQEARADEDRFLACLAKATAEQRSTSSNRSASNFAPKLFAGMEMGRGVSVIRFETAMERLLDRGAILAAQPLFRRANRQFVTGIGLAPTLAPTPHQPLHEAAPTASGEPL